MQGYIPRHQGPEVERRLANSPIVALLGPRQCGKTTLAQHLASGRTQTVHLDLERPSDLRKLTDPEAFFALHREDLIVLDEIQRKPDLFPILRSTVDERQVNCQFLILGSASPELLRQGSESLAGRIAFVELAPLLLPEVNQHSPPQTLQELWLRGGYPRSWLATSLFESFEWRSDFIRTFLERDLASLAPRIASSRLGRFWRMIAHEHGQILNGARLGSALGVSAHTLRSYLELFERSFMLRSLPPCHANLGKRVVKSPKIYLRDAGILHALLEIEDHDDLLGHPVRGASWEGMCIEHILCALPRWRPSFFRTRDGAEIDLVLERGQRRIAIECKASTAPKPTRGFWNALEALEPDAAYVVAPIKESFPLDHRVSAVSLAELIDSVTRT